MKKVRLVISAVGVAPALGLIAPATANAAATVTHGPKKAAKTVPILRRNGPDYTCASSKINGESWSKDYRYHAANTYGGTNCIHHQWASLDFAQTGLAERVRYYSGGGKQEGNTLYLAGKINSGSSTLWQSYPNFNAAEVCQALVANGNHNDVEYGPLCERP
ncbi:MAG TPA: hypothetical protein VMC03_20335 [Streptosporangiaceae bacterium]|nr:hypothetical protein [Streptosporangiaceae bacterium]